MIRTDLAIEAVNAVCVDKAAAGVDFERTEVGGVTVERVHIRSAEGERAVGKGQGTYVTVTGNFFAHASPDNLEQMRFCVATELTRLLGGREKGGVLVVGLGNRGCTPDALGPLCVSHLFVTRHMKAELSRILDDPALLSVSGLAPGVLGQTGLETGEVVRGVVEQAHPSLVIAVDALVAKDAERLGTTVQLASVGLSPGSGVGNKRAELSQASLGVPVISVGVPTVVDAETLGGRAGDDRIVTPREIDLLIDRAARLVADGINRALYPSLDKEDLAALAEN